MSIGISALIALKINEGRNWAWVVYVGFFFFGLLSTLYSVLAGPNEVFASNFQGFSQYQFHTTLNMITHYGIQGIAVVLLLQKSSRKWFNAQPPKVVEIEDQPESGETE